MTTCSSSKEGGFALLGIVLVMLLVIGLLSIVGSKTTILETKMVFNTQDKQRSLTAAESVAHYGLVRVLWKLDIKKVINNDRTGYYVLGDKITTTFKSLSDWNAINTIFTWPWVRSFKAFIMPRQMGGPSNPMQLRLNPRYAVGVHNAVIRKGTANYKCLPVSILGGSQGGTEQTRTLIELRVIPKNTCFRNKIK